MRRRVGRPELHRALGVAQRVGVLIELQRQLGDLRIELAAALGHQLGRLLQRRQRVDELVARALRPAPGPSTHRHAARATAPCRRAVQQLLGHLGAPHLHQRVGGDAACRRRPLLRRLVARAHGRVAILPGDDAEPPAALRDHQSRWRASSCAARSCFAAARENSLAHMSCASASRCSRSSVEPSPFAPSRRRATASPPSG